MKKKARTPKKGAGKKWSQKLQDLGNQPPPKELTDKINENVDVMTVAQKMSEISRLERVDTPWHVMRIFGKVELFGNQVSFNSNGSSDFVTLSEAKEATAWIVKQFGGKVTWD